MIESMQGSVLDHPTLVLNKGWQGINAKPVREALGDVLSERANILHPDEYTQHNWESWTGIPVGIDEPALCTPRSRIKIPEIIILKDYNKVRHRRVKFSRRNLWKRDNFCCQFCGHRPRNDEITMDHVVPKSRGGKSSFKNCVLACIECNKRKDNRTPEEAGMRLFRWVKGQEGEPVKQYYNRPKAPTWSPLYSVGRRRIPRSWTSFVKNMIDDLYWDTELEP